MHSDTLEKDFEIKKSGFETLVGALEYAAGSGKAVNFYGGRGQLTSVLTYQDLMEDAKALARGLLQLGCAKGSCVAIVAETDPDFHRFFFACQYAGLIPVPLPAGIQLGAHQIYVAQLRQMLLSCHATIAVAPDTHIKFLREAAEGLDDIRVGLPGDFARVTDETVALRPAQPEDLAYLQYTSGSTCFPRGVEITQQSALKNVQEIAEYGLKVGPEDRFVSWLPLYHDMGLVGFVLLPMATQSAADLMSPRTFAMRPRLWLKILSDNGGTITSSPPFGYALCAKRLRASDTEKYDLSSLRAACVGADRIHPEPLRDFAQALAPSGFRSTAFVACYGMAECALAVSFAPLDHGIDVDIVNRKLMADDLVAQSLSGPARSELDTLSFVDCGVLLPSYEMSFRDENGNEVPERHCGTIFLRGSCVMRGYFHNTQATRAVLDEHAWLNTGDIGYRIGDRIFITARGKDVIIINGKNIWPQDLEHLADGIDGVRQAGVSAFAAANESGEEATVIVVESRERDETKRSAIVDTLIHLAHANFGIQVFVDVVEPGVLARTSSGKLSRSRTKTDFYERSPASFFQWRVNGMTNSQARPS